MKLRKLGGRYQPIIDSTDDILSIIDVDAQHWSANCAPIEGLSCDKGFLEFLDMDNNGKILPFEVEKAIQWLKDSLRDMNGLWSESDSISLSAFRTDHPLGDALYKSAKYVLDSLGDKEERIHLDFIRSRTKILQAGSMNGDGVIPPSAATDEQEKQAIKDIVAVMGGKLDCNGELGVDALLLQSFIQQVPKWLEWKEKEPSTSFALPRVVVPNIIQIQPILDAFFVACFTNPSIPKEETSTPLLSIPNEEGVLSWDAWIHPLYREKWKFFATHCTRDSFFSWHDWENLWEEARTYSAWLAAEPKGAFSSLSDERLKELFSATEIHSHIQQQIHDDLASAQQLSKLADLEKTVLFQKNILSFVNSYVNFSHFYNPDCQSLPEQGNLLMDGRLFRLSVLVTNREKHKTRAKDSGFFLLYITVHDPKKEFEIATAVTGKRRGDLHIGKKGVFIRIGGGDFPATVVDILDNPINIQEAFWAPFSSVRGFVQKRFETLSSKHQKELETNVQKELIPEDPTSKAALLNGGVTVAALSSSFAYLIKTLSSIQVSQLFTVMFAPLLVVAILSSLIAWWKLQNRDLGPILEASGWGINHPLYAPSWATKVFTLPPIVPRDQQSTKPDLLLTYQKSIDPYGRVKGIFFMLFWFVVVLGFWYGFDYLILLYEWSDLYQPQK